MKRTYILSFLLCALLLAASSNIWTPKKVTLTFQTKTGQDILLQTSFNDSCFKNEDTSTLIPRGGGNEVKIKIFASKINRLCLKFANPIDELTLSNFKLSGKKNLVFKDFDSFNFEGSAKVQDDNNFITITPSLTDAKITINNISFKGKYSFNFHFFMILAIIYFLISYKIVQYLSVFKIKDSSSRIDIVFVAFFYVLIFLPMSNISDDSESMSENRNLAQKPSLTDLYKSDKYSKNFELWFNDHFFLRKAFVKFYEFLNDPLSLKGNKRVLIGKNNWLFYKGDNSERNFANLDLLTEEELENLATYLKNIQQWAKKNGKSFYYLICPDKNKIYGEFYQFHEKVYPDSQSRAQQVVNYLKENTDIEVIYPFDALHQAKTQGLLYYKNDTHWNSLGAYVGYQELMKSIEKKHKLKIFKYSKLNEEKHPLGDLSKMFSTPKEDNETTYLVPPIQDLSKCTGEEKEINCINHLGKLRVFMLRDSFTDFLKPYLNNTFKFVDYNWRYNITRSDLKKIKNDADIIILEQLERLLPTLTTLKFPKE